MKIVKINKDERAKDVLSKFFNDHSFRIFDREVGDVVGVESIKQYSSANSNFGSIWVINDKYWVSSLFQIDEDTKLRDKEGNPIFVHDIVTDSLGNTSYVSNWVEVKEKNLPDFFLSRLGKNR